MEDTPNRALDFFQNAEEKYVISLFVDMPGAFDNLWKRRTPWWRETSKRIPYQGGRPDYLETKIGSTFTKER